MAGLFYSSFDSTDAARSALKQILELSVSDPAFISKTMALAARGLLPATPSPDAPTTIERLACEQGVKPVAHLDDVGISGCYLDLTIDQP